MKISTSTSIITFLALAMVINWLDYCDRHLKDFGKPSQEVIDSENRLTLVMNQKLLNLVEKHSAMSEALSEELFKELIRNRILEMQQEEPKFNAMKNL